MKSVDLFFWLQPHYGHIFEVLLNSPYGTPDVMLKSNNESPLTIYGKPMLVVITIFYGDTTYVTSFKTETSPTVFFESHVIPDLEFSN